MEPVDEVQVREALDVVERLLVLREELDAAVANLRAKMQTEDPDAIYEAMTAANTAADPLTQAQMDAVLKKTAVGKKLEEF